ncbi:hypothetical protein OOK29_25730 [Streptomyces phaeochromogenes]|uniref:tyrosine-type recombinase/integrase n=1 Tax=Streptomyces phaeochromogenes TaxID=1923 RepID=UPI00224DEDBC|nr:hypothetical protein [Streptomyces phaeochromogenes]MCX5601554.1 hypothetical protein [Streptomyces phaeochromogenes]
MPSAEKRGKTWRARYKKPDGKWGSEPGFPTKSAALSYARKQEGKVEEGRFVDPKAGRLTIGAWAKKWLDMIEVDELSDETYRSRVRAQILPRWENTAVADVKTSDHRIWMKEVRGRQSKNYANDIEGVFRMLMEDAVAEGLIAVNPVPAQRRRRGKYEPEEAAEDDYIFPDPLQALVLAENATVIRGEVGEAMVLTKAYTAMRLAEIIALRREFCWIGPERDPWDQYIRVEHQGHYRKGGFKLRPPKYHSYRTLILPPFLADVLWKLLESHDKEYVFPSAWGKPIRTDDQFYGRFWDPIVEGHDALPQIRGRKFRPQIHAVEGLSGMVPHGLRHGHRVWLEEADCAEAAIHERMGHKVRSSGKGVSTYRHVTPAMRKRIAKTLQRNYEKSVKDRRELAGK